MIVEAPKYVCATEHSVNKLTVFLGILLFVVALGTIFQFFGRYQYVVVGRTVWRIDRLTNQSCRIVQQRCAPPPISTSTSPSLSTSTSTKVLGPTRSQPKKT